MLLKTDNKSTRNCLHPEVNLVVKIHRGFFLSPTLCSLKYTQPSPTKANQLHFRLFPFLLSVVLSVVFLMGLDAYILSYIKLATERNLGGSSPPDLLRDVNNFLLICCLS